MRFGLFTVAFSLFLVFLVIINASDITDEQVDVVFENLDTNLSDDNYSTDANLSNFVKYTVKGIANELHGTYYFAAWLSPHLPRRLIENGELLAFLGVVLLIGLVCGKIILLIALALFMLIWEQIKKRRSKNGKEKG